MNLPWIDRGCGRDEGYRLRPAAMVERFGRPVVGDEETRLAGEELF
jgi:hypothetical protein